MGLLWQMGWPGPILKKKFPIGGTMEHAADGQGGVESAILASGGLIGSSYILEAKMEDFLKQFLIHITVSV